MLIFVFNHNKTMKFVISVLDFIRIDEKNYEFRLGPKSAVYPKLIFMILTYNIQGCI